MCCLLGEKKKPALLLLGFHPPPEPPGLEVALSGAEDSVLEHTTEKSVVYQGFSLLMHLNNISFTERLLSGQMTQVTENSYFYLLQHKRL